MSESTLYLETMPTTIDYPGGSSVPMELVTDVTKRRPRKNLLGFLAVNRLSYSVVSLAHEEAARLEGIYGRLYAGTQGGELESPTTLIDCHSFAGHVFGHNSTPNPYLWTPFHWRLDARNHINSRLVPGKPYGIGLERAIDPKFQNQHSMIAVDDGSRCLSVLGENGFISVASIDALLGHYQGETIQEVVL
jgi:hypothetical protein